MNKNRVKSDLRAEHGGAGIKFLIVLLSLVLAANAAFNYIPVAYEGENFKQEMHTIVVQGMAIPTNGVDPISAMKTKLINSAKDYDLPAAFVDVRRNNNITSARVKYSKQVSLLPFGIYNYNYEFDHTATPAGFLTKNN
ncbi:MAG: hypothetical protein ACR2L1_06000 [Pyrinomonadaceae bacterium]